MHANDEKGHLPNGLPVTLTVMITRCLVAAALMSVLVGCHGVAPTPTVIGPSPLGVNVSVSANPPMLFFGGSSLTITARATDVIEGAARGRTMRFTANSGTLSAASATTDSDGRASVTLTGSANTRVTASVDTSQAATLDIQAQEPFSVRVGIMLPTPTSTTVLAWTAFVSVIPAAGVTSAPIPERVEVNCGTGTPVEVRPGYVGDAPFSCLATSAGTYETRATALAGGYIAQATATVSASPTLPAFNVALMISGGTGGPRLVSFSVLVTPDTRLAASYDFDFGDGIKTGPINSYQTDHFYSTAGTYTPKVTVRSSDGRSQTASAPPITVN